jgi:hypothetical protein
MVRREKSIGTLIDYCFNRRVCLNQKYLFPSFSTAFIYYDRAYFQLKLSSLFHFDKLPYSQETNVLSFPIEFPLTLLRGSGLLRKRC